MAVQTSREKLEKLDEQREPQQQGKQPGEQTEMAPTPDCGEKTYRVGPRLTGKAAIVTGGDSGIGRAVVIAFAREGADVAIVYKEEDKDAEDTAKYVRDAGRKCVLIRGDVGHEEFCKDAVEQAVKQFGRLDILVNNAAEQHEVDSLEELSAEQLERTFRTNIFGYFFMAKHALKHMKEGASIINTTSVTSYRGHPTLLDYSSTKGAITAFTRALATSLTDRDIRVNGVAPGPIWTPLIPASFPPDKVESFGKDTPMGRAGQPVELAGAYVHYASDESSYETGQIIHIGGGGWMGG